MKHIHIDWSGPLSYDQAVRELRGPNDYGVYQIYGTHPIYGSNVLLYIGKADKQNFGTRLNQEQWPWTNAGTSLSVYVGRLGGYEGTPSNKEWSSQIEIAERMLIVAHWPAGNSSGLNVSFGKEYHSIHILNWGNYCDLLPEVSGSRYSDLFESYEKYDTFTEKSE